MPATRLLKSFVRRTIASGAQTVAWPRRRLRGRVCILTYHRVLRPEQVQAIRPQPGMYVTSGTFAEHLAFLTDNFNVLSMQALLDAWRTGGLDEQAPHCVITFDDGWRDNFEEAFPLLARRRVPATIFLPTAFVGTQAWFWPDLLLLHLQRLDATGTPAARAAFRQEAGLPGPGGAKFEQGSDEVVEHFKLLPVPRREELLGRFIDEDLSRGRPHPVMDWDTVQAMSAANISFGSHTHTHAILTQLSDDDVRQELSTSIRMVMQPRVNGVRAIAYPNGNCDARIAALAQACGYEAGFSGTPGSESGAPSSLLSLRRIGIHEGIAPTAALLAFHMAGGNQVLSWP